MTSTGMMRSVDRALSVGAPLMGSITPEGARELENHCVSVKGAEGQSDFFLGGDGRGGARVRASRGERGRERREGRTSSASRKASRKKESEGRVRAMVVSQASVSYTREVRVQLWLETTRVRTSRGFSSPVVVRAFPDLRASRTRPMRRDPTSSTSVFPGKGRARSELKRVFSTDKTQTLVRLEAFFPSAARREPYRAAGARRDPRPALQRSLYIDRDLSRAAEESCSREPERSTPRLARENEMSFVDLPAHVALTILRRLDARDLCALRATCRAFDAALVETAAFEATRARAPWLAAPRPREGPERAPASAKREDESWLDLLRFAELAASARLPRVVANEDVTAVVDREGRVHVWGPVVDAQGHERDDVTPDVTPDVTRAPNADAAKGTQKNEKVFVRASRCVAIAAGHACSFGAGGHRGGLRAFRNVAGIETNAMSGSGNPASRPPEFASTAAGVGVESAFEKSLFFRPRIVSVAAGRMHALAAAADGSLWSWGNDAAGQLGLGSTRGASALVQHFAGSLERLSSSPKSRDRARRMRRDRDGAGGSPRAASPFFGDGDASSRADAAKFFPGGVGGVGGSRAFETRTGRVSSFENDGARAAWFDTPMRRVERFSESPSGTAARRRVVSVAASRHGSACVAADGALFCWGSNRRGALGLGDDLDRDVPTRVRVCASGSDDDDASASSDGGGSDDDADVFGASDDDASEDVSFSSRARAVGVSARRFPGALSDTDSDSDADRARATNLSLSRGGKGKAPECVPSGARARRRETAPRRAPGHKKKNATPS